MAMLNAVLASEAGVSADFTAPTNVKDTVSQITDAAGGIFDLGTKAFSFMLSNPLCFLMIGSGFCFTALGLARKALRASKRT